ncbi:hypothetical protein LWI29_008242 [Acer saccharum]|uniref:Uncharacterized protein n=1 Tax=Acer saccharum TaxID=4024 RepID=A0AA39RYX2_ACESA|nr:hypothetical protein LWI29_008242 [Acer saccharum]
MAENEHQSRERSIDIDQDNNLEEILEAGPDCCIYRVPQYLRKINEEAYTPYFISIGPLHYGRKELMGMERQKRRYWSEFGKRLNNTQKLEEFKTYIKNQEQTIRAHYSVTSTISSSKYVEIILHDAIFIIELFMRNDSGHKDFLVNNEQHIVSISQDLLLLENQIPYFVLNHLYSLVFPCSGHPSFFSLCLKFFENTGMFKWSLSEQPQLKHFTDFQRCAAVGHIQRTVQSGGGILDLPCATKLKKSGLEFKGIEHTCLHRISLGKRKLGKRLPWFGVNELQIPRIIISDKTEKNFRNLMALEIFHYPTKTYICHYADLMDHLIDTDKDVDLLVEKGIIINQVGDIEARVKMFNRLNLHIAIGNSPYYKDVEKMKAHYNIHGTI